MNANTLPMNTSKYEKLEERANAQINKHNYSNDQVTFLSKLYQLGNMERNVKRACNFIMLKAIRDVPEIRQVTDKISQEQKRKSDSNSTQPSRAHIFLPSSTKDIYSPTGKNISIYIHTESMRVYACIYVESV